MLELEYRLMNIGINTFIGNDKTFIFGEFKRWREECFKQGKTLNPDDFKKKKELKK